MEPTSANELLLTTLADRDSRIRTARFKLGRLIALFAGLATVLLMAGHHPAKASGLSSMLPEGAGISISVPLGEVAGSVSRPGLQIFALVGDDEPVRFDLDRPERIAFAPIAVAGGIAGVAAWPSRQHPTIKRSNHGAAGSPLRASEQSPARAADAIPGTQKAEAARTRIGKVDARRNARLATLSYQQMLRRYHLLPQNAPRTNAHAQLMRAYRVALAWRKFAAQR